MGLLYCHRQGVTHRDLKPDNLLLDDQCKLKIADFGFAAPIEGRDGSGFLRTYLGTQNYMAPEFHLQQPYKGHSVDIFAAGIILFIMVTVHPPFDVAHPSDLIYKYLAANRADKFWEKHSINKQNGDAFISPQLKQLIQSMLQLDPIHRPSLLEILYHPWMQGPLPAEEEAIKDYQERMLTKLKQEEPIKKQVRYEDEIKLKHKPDRDGKAQAN